MEFHKAYVSNKQFSLGIYELKGRPSLEDQQNRFFPLIDS